MTVSLYSNADVRLMVNMFDNFVGQTGYVGNFANDPNHVMYETPPTISNGNNTRFGYRQPIRTNGDPYWFLQGTGDTALEQEIVTEQINTLAECGVHGVIVLYFPQPSEVISAPTSTPPRNPYSQYLWQWLRYYLTSPAKSRLKFAIQCTSGVASYDASIGSASNEFTNIGTYLNLPSFAAYWASLMQDPDYLKDDDGNPFFYTFDSLSTPWTLANCNEVTNAAIAAGFSAVQFVTSNQDETQAATINAEVGGYNNSIGTGTQNPYATQIAKDRTYWAGTRNKQLAMAHCNDGRPPRGVGTWYTDYGTYSQAERSVLTQMYAQARAYRKCPEKIVTLYSAGEIAEAGAFFPTRQLRARGVNTPSYGIWLDAIRNVRSSNYPSTYTDCYHASWAHADITRTGGANWTTANSITNGGGSNPAAFEFSEHRNSTAGNTITIAPALPCTGIRVYGRLGPTFGSFDAQTNGGGATTVNQSAGSDSFNVLLYDSGVLAVGLHNVKLTMVAGTTSIDEFRADISR